MGLGGVAKRVRRQQKLLGRVCVCGAPGRAMDLKKELHITATCEIRKRERRAGAGQGKMGAPRASIGGRKEWRLAEFPPGII